MDAEYVEKLEHVIKQMLIPIKDIPFNLVIESISDFKVLPFDPKEEKDKNILDKLIEVAQTAGEEVNKMGIIRPRPNEVGNDIEPYVKKALNKVGYRASTPLASDGNKKAAGYPDIEFTTDLNEKHYLECKTYNAKNINTTQRSFYLSPSKSFKVTKDAHHLVISFEIFVAETRGQNKVYKCQSWKLLSIDKLPVDVKYEFNSDNRRLYSSKLILAQGSY